ncbi:MAG: SpoIIE family protein phosphatase [Bacteroidetes bacterium]|nr:SpoIIE family protein phosphatase [Bacteroidota bacterium]
MNKSAKGEKFITAFFAVLNTKAHTLNYVNAGQNPPFIFIRMSSHFLIKGTTGLGMFEKLPFVQEGMAYLPQGAMYYIIQMEL